MTASLRYPKDRLYDQDTDYVMFEFFKYQPPFAGGSGEGGRLRDGGVNTYNTSGGQETQSAGPQYKPIFMYMPEDIQAQFASDWGDKSFTNAQADALRVAGRIVSGGGTGLGELIKAVGNTSGRLNSAIAQGVVSAINALPGGVGGQTNINQVLSGTNGIVLNPNVELLFNGFGIREFDLNYKFAPQNEAEALEIKRIINTFKKASLPTWGSDRGILDGFANAIGAKPEPPLNEESFNRNYITVPKLVQVKYMKGSKLHPYLPKWKLGVILGVDINYTPDGSFATYRDGSPVATGMTLRFSETKLVYGNEINIESTEAQY